MANNFFVQVRGPFVANEDLVNLIKRKANITSDFAITKLGVVINHNEILITRAVQHNDIDMNTYKRAPVMKDIKHNPLHLKVDSKVFKYITINGISFQLGDTGILETDYKMPVESLFFNQDMDALTALDVTLDVIEEEKEEEQIIDNSKSLFFHDDENDSINPIMIDPIDERYTKSIDDSIINNDIL